MKAILVTLLFIASLSNAQHKKKLIRGLDSKNTIELFQLFETFWKNKNSIVHYRKMDLVENYQALSFTLEISKGKIDSDGTYYSYQFEIICSDSIIHQTVILSANDTIHFESDDGKIEDLERLYENTYNFKLSLNDVFKSNISYGSSCGRIGENPKERNLMKKAIKENDKKSLLNWLRSPVLELNLYGLEGLSSFQVNSFSEKDLELIQQVKKKKGSVQVCSGCEYTRREFQEYAKKFFKDLEE